MIYRATKIKKVENEIWGMFDSVKIMTDDALSCVFFFSIWTMDKNNYYHIILIMIGDLKSIQDNNVATKKKRVKGRGR